MHLPHNASSHIQPDIQTDEEGYLAFRILLQFVAQVFLFHLEHGVITFRPPTLAINDDDDELQVQVPDHAYP